MRIWFLASVAVVLAASRRVPARAADAPTDKRDDAASEKLGLKLSLQCWTFNRLTFFETVDKAAGLGVKYLEMYPGQKLKPGSDCQGRPEHERRRRSPKSRRSWPTQAA